MTILELRDKLYFNYNLYAKSAPGLGSSFYYDVGCSGSSFTQWEADLKGLEHIVTCIEKNSPRKYVFIEAKDYQPGKKRALGRMASVIESVRADYATNQYDPYVFLTEHVSETWKSEMKSINFIDAQTYLDKMAKVVTRTAKKSSDEKVEKNDQPWFKTELLGYKTSLNKILATYPDRHIVYQVASNKDCYNWDGTKLVSSHNLNSDIHKACEFFGVEEPVIIYMNPTVFKMFGNMSGYESASDFLKTLMNSRKDMIKSKLQEPVYITEYYPQGAEKMVAFLNGRLPENHIYMKLLKAAIDGSDKVSKAKRSFRSLAGSLYSYDEMTEWIKDSEHDIDKDLYAQYPLLQWCDSPYDRWSNFEIRTDKAEAFVEYIEMMDARKAA